MSKLMPVAALSLLVAATAARSADGQEPRDEHPSLASRVLATYAPTRAEGEGAAARVAAVDALVDALPEERWTELMLPVDHAERANWTNVPPGADELGLRLGDCDEAGLKAACDLLATVLSAEGYARTRDILLADDKLLRGGRPRVGFGAENFWLVVFGEPTKDGAWGLQLDGHHIALNLSFHGERMTMSPTFLGAQPSRFERGDESFEPLADPIAAAFELAGSLTDEQRGVAVVAATRGRNVAAAGRDGFVPEREGLPCSDLGEEQRAHVMALVRSVVRDLPAAAAEARMKEIASELPEMHVSWRGPTEPKSDVSFRLQGPSLILEYACQDLGGDPLDHLHLMIRNPKNEYGAGF